MCRFTLRYNFPSPEQLNQTVIRSWQQLRLCAYAYKKTILVALIYKPSSDLLLWCWLAKVVHITNPHAHPPNIDIARCLAFQSGEAVLKVSLLHYRELVTANYAERFWFCENHLFR
ncbi:hypothetical protein TNCV_814391 [Trichonephila clavipes]|nr:hypothetical protein TNCV_814391 [Trichonephila clavipes]